MKFTTEHFRILKNAIKVKLTDSNITIVEIEVQYENQSEQRKLWDIYWWVMSGVYNKEVIQPLFYQYYDSHIETALRKAWNEIKNSSPVS